MSFIYRDAQNTDLFMQDDASNSIDASAADVCLEDADTLMPPSTPAPGTDMAMPEVEIEIEREGLPMATYLSPPAVTPKTPKPRLAQRRRPTTLLLSPHTIRRVSPASSKSQSSSSRRARIYQNQVIGARSVSGGGVAFESHPDCGGASTSARFGSEAGASSLASPMKSRRASSKKVTSPSAKAVSLGLLGFGSAMGSVFGSLKRLKAVGGGRGVQKVGGVLGWKMVKAGKGMKMVMGGRRGDENTTPLSARSYSSASPLRGFAMAQEVHLMQRRGSVAMTIEEDFGEGYLHDDDDDDELYSPMPTSPLAHFHLAGSTPNIVEESFDGSGDRQELTLNHSRSLDTLLIPTPSITMIAMEDVEEDEHYHPEAAPAGGESENRSADSEMAEMVLAPPLSPVTNYNLSPVSISSSMKRARSKGKAMRVLGYEVHEAYSRGQMFASGLPRKKRAMRGVS